MVRLLSKPLVSTFVIEDGDDSWTVSFRQMTEGDFTAIADIEGKRDVLYNPDGTFFGFRETRNPRTSERLGIYRTLSACSLKWEDTGELIFDSKEEFVKKAMSERQFNAAWDLLPPEIAGIIVNKFYEANPTLKAG